MAKKKPARRKPKVQGPKSKVAKQPAQSSAAAPPEAAHSERDRNAARMRAARAKTRVVEIPKCDDPKRRRRLEKDIFQWLAWYAHEPYGEHGFTDQIKTIITDLRNAHLRGGDQADAASRGEGKTTGGEWVETFMAITGQGGQPHCSILFEANRKLAEDSLSAIRERLETNDRLAADYPEVCIPIRELQHSPQRARTQLVSGYRHDNGERYENVPSHFQWAGGEIVLPRVPGSPAAGAIIAARGLDSAVRGIKFGGKAVRPTVAIINDPDNDDTVNNPEEQGAKLEKKIESSIGGLGGQKRELARIILTTVQRKGTVSDRFTNPKIKPSFKGRRFRFLVKPPDRLDLWEQYVQLSELDWLNEVEGRPTTLARDFYVKNRKVMDAGAVVANPNRRPGGQLSGLQYYYDFVARKGAAAAATELDNDPREETGAVESGITPLRIQRQVNGLARGIVPAGCQLVVMAIDCRRVALHWVARAWRADGTGFTIDYGEHLTRGTTAGSNEGIDLALRQAIKELVAAKKATPYRDAAGQAVPLRLTLVDSGWRADAVYAACREIGLGIMPAKGIGRSAGTAMAARFSDVLKQTADRTPGDGWFISRAGPPGGQVALVSMDTDRWKGFEHDRWMQEPREVGAMTIFGQASEDPNWLSTDQRDHWRYARHITAEVEVEEIEKGVLKRKWKPKSHDNHWLDASYMTDVAASICGVRLLPSIVAGEQAHVVAAPTGDETLKRGDLMQRFVSGRDGGW